MNDDARATQPEPAFTFRKGTVEDHQRCAELWMDALARRDGTHRDPKVMHRALTKLTGPGAMLIVAERDSRTHGFALAADKTPRNGTRTAHLTLLAVDPVIQSFGLGRSLLAYMTDLLVTEGFVQVTLSVLEDNAAARRIYDDAGWHVTSKGVFEDSGRPCVRYILGPNH